jgi:hypothetical protein
MIHATPGTNNVLSNTAPVLAPIANQYVYLGQTLSLPAQASDADVPQQVLTFSLDPGAPANASVNALSGLLTWTPTASQVSGIFPITVRVTDNGIPPMSATQTFSTTVLNPPALGMVNINGNNLTLGWSSVPGRVYRVQYKDSLSAPSWTTLGADQPGTGAILTFNANVSLGPQRYYRILIVQ